MTSVHHAGSGFRLAISASAEFFTCEEAEHPAAASSTSGSEEEGGPQASLPEHPHVCRAPLLYCEGDAKVVAQKQVTLAMMTSLPQPTTKTEHKCPAFFKVYGFAWICSALLE